MHYRHSAGVEGEALGKEENTASEAESLPSRKSTLQRKNVRVQRSKHPAEI